MNRLTLARHFHALTSITREDLFGSQEATCRPLHLQNDAATMFAGYVGANYATGRSLLILAINPGGGGDKYTRRTPDDEEFYPLLQDFKNVSESDVLDCVEEINVSFERIVTNWNLWRILNPTLSVVARRLAWTRIVGPTISLGTDTCRTPPRPYTSRCDWNWLVIELAQANRSGKHSRTA